MDTDACIEIIHGNPAPFIIYPEDDFTVLWITSFEVLTGLRGQKQDANTEVRAQAFLEARYVLGFDAASLARQTLDLWYPILTRNSVEFSHVTELRVLSGVSSKPLDISAKILTVFKNGQHDDFG